MLIVEYTNQFKRDLKLVKKRGEKLHKLQKVMTLIEYETKIPDTHKDHTLNGNWAYHRELHIEPDWLLIYRYKINDDTVVFVRTGSHSDLFR